MIKTILPLTTAAATLAVAEVATATPNDLASLVSNVGFPIVMCFGLFFYIQKRVDKLSEALNNNTTVIAKLLERLDKANE